MQPLYSASVGPSSAVYHYVFSTEHLSRHCEQYSVVVALALVLALGLVLLLLAFALVIFQTNN